MLEVEGGSRAAIIGSLAGRLVLQGARLVGPTGMSSGLCLLVGSARLVRVCKWAACGCAIRLRRDVLCMGNSRKEEKE